MFATNYLVNPLIISFICHKEHELKLDKITNYKKSIRGKEKKNRYGKQKYITGMKGDIPKDNQKIPRIQDHHHYQEQMPFPSHLLQHTGTHTE